MPKGKKFQIEQFRLIFLPPIVRSKIYNLLDFIDHIIYPNRMIPPRSLMMVDTGKWEQVGREFKDIFIRYGKLQPIHRFLDVGCGAGRMALPLTEYLIEGGEYWGFDNRYNCIAWCESHINKKNNNFHFIHSDIRNKKYNSNGKIEAKDYKFPFSDDYFDFVFLGSLFTHMLPPGVENYLSEVSRVLKADGICLITLLLINDEPEKMGYIKIGMLDFRFDHGKYFTINEENPEFSVAYKEEYFMTLSDKLGLPRKQLIRHGSWSDRIDYLTSQDLVFLRKDIVIDQ